MREGIARAAALLAGAERLVVATGAGMSRESGIPTFRDAQEGLWARFDPAQLATEQGFRAAPARVWGWYAWRRARIAACQPHAGHAALCRLEEIVPEVTVVTQNIDGLHQLAGSRQVVELHGSIAASRCLDAGHPYRGELPLQEAEGEVPPPPCPQCGSPLRPGVVWFGEMLPSDAVERAWRLAEACDAMLVVGTSGTVWPAAELPHLARGAGATVIEVGPEPAGITPVAHFHLRGEAGSVLPALVRELEAVRGGGP
jgi:NAD-dependent deacetylase